MASRSGIRNYRFSFNLYITPAIQWLIIANVGVYILEILLDTKPGLSEDWARYLRDRRSDVHELSRVTARAQQ